MFKKYSHFNFHVLNESVSQGRTIFKKMIPIKDEHLQEIESKIRGWWDDCDNNWDLPTEYPYHYHEYEKGTFQRYYDYSKYHLSWNEEKKEYNCQILKELDEHRWEFQKDPNFRDSDKISKEAKRHGDMVGVLDSQFKYAICFVVTKEILQRRNQIGFLPHIVKMFHNKGYTASNLVKGADIRTRKDSKSNNEGMWQVDFGNYMVRCLHYLLDGMKDRSNIDNMRDLSGNKKRLIDFIDLSDAKSAFNTGKFFTRLKRNFINRLPNAQKRLIWKDNNLIDPTNEIKLYYGELMRLERMDAFLSKVARIKTADEMLKTMKEMSKVNEKGSALVKKINSREDSYTHYHAPDYSYIVAEVLTSDAVIALAPMTNWCIKQEIYFVKYTSKKQLLKPEGREKYKNQRLRQFIIFWPSRKDTDPLSVLGLTISDDGTIFVIQDKNDKPAKYLPKGVLKNGKFDINLLGW